VERTVVTMGAPLRVAIWTADTARAEAATGRIVAEFDRLDALLSVWKDGSDVRRLNAAAGVAPVPVSRDTLDLLEAAITAGDLTGGKFDITFGALADIWKFDHDQDNIVPPRSAIDARLPLVDYQAVHVDRAAATAFLARPGMRVHLGGIGKGYAIDRSAALLRAAGLTDFLIQSGGDLYVSGTHAGAPWALGIADPRRPERVFASLRLTNATLSTSGDYERFFLADGVRYHHLLDPDRGEPARGCRSVTIVAASALVADALSTGVFILGPDLGLALVERTPDVEAVIVTASGEVRISSGLQGRVEYTSPVPTSPESSNDE